MNGALLLWLVSCAPARDDTACAARYVDEDGDGFGNAAGASTACDLDARWADNGDDCDDTRADVAPGLEDGCDGLDQDCDGLVDEDAAVSTFYTDADGDGFGAGPVSGCAAPPGSVSADGDCDDSDPGVFPGADDPCDAVDQDCDGDVSCAAATSQLTLAGDLEWAFGDAVATGDATGDGIDDVVWGKGEGFVFGLVPGPINADLDLLGASVATFEDSDEYEWDSTALSPGVFIGFDADADGVGDLAAFSSWDVLVWPATAGLHRLADARRIRGENPYGVSSIQAADFNADGIDDILLGLDDHTDYDELDPRAWIFYGPLLADRSLDVADASLRGDRDDSRSRAADLGDVDGDGVSDVLVGSMVYAGPIDGDRVEADATAALDTSTAIGVGDVNGDGVGDVWARVDNDRAALLAGPLSGTVQAASAADSFELVDGLRASVLGRAGDIDGDGRDDLSMGLPGEDIGPGEILVWLGPFSGAHTAADRTIAGPTLAAQLGGAITAGDLDHDGLSDIIGTARGWWNGLDDVGALIVRPGGAW